jgi:hypothetical protein
MTERVESRANAYSLDDVLSKIDNHYNCMKHIEPVKRDLSVEKQNDGKDRRSQATNLPKRIQQSGIAQQVLKNSDISS